MKIINAIYNWIDPDHLIPIRAWYRVVSIGVLSGLLFFATVILALLKERSIARSVNMKDLTQWTFVIGEELDKMQNHVVLYEENLNNYIAEGRKGNLQAALDFKAAILKNSIKLDSLFFIPENRKILLRMVALIDSSFVTGTRAVEIRNRGNIDSARVEFAKLKALDVRHNFLIFSNKIYQNRSERLDQFLFHDNSGSVEIYRRFLIPLIILSGILFLLMISSLVIAVEEVMKVRSANKLMYEEQKKSAELARNLMNLAMVGYHSIGRNGFFLEINQTELDWLGYSHKEVVGKKRFSDLFEPASDLRMEEIQEIFIRDGYVTNLELNLITRTGERIPALFNSKAIYHADGSFSHSISTVYNFSERKELEKQLISARQEAEHANHMKQLFMANMSHEIRTPLNAIIGFTNLLARAELPVALLEYVENIQVSGANLLGIVNDILDFEKIRAGELHIDQIEFDLNGLLHSVITMMQPSAKDKQLALYLGTQMNLPSSLIGDPMRLTQILVNLLGNAVKFTGKGHVTLRVSQAPSRGSEESIRIRFDVEDTGIGIPESEHSRIFDRFSQAGDGTARKYGGTGLGLALVKMLVEMQGGVIQVSSEEGRGSVFSVEIPYRFALKKGNTPPDIHHPIKPELPDLSGFKILLVEDNPINSRIAELYFSELGLAVSTAANGREAIEKLTSGQQRFDMVFMDIQMPEMDGYTATRFIRTELGMTEIPVIAMTAHVLAGERENVLSSGMNDYLSKPINHKELIGILLRYLTGGSARKF